MEIEQLMGISAEEFFRQYWVRKSELSKSCGDCDLNKKCGAIFLGCPLPPLYNFKLKKNED